MLLSSYMQRVQRLLGDTMFERFNPYDLIHFINEARDQVAEEGECIREELSFSTIPQQEVYYYRALSGLQAGAVSILTIFSLRIIPEPGSIALPITLEGRPWEWFDFYFRSLSRFFPTRPTAWSQFQQGAGRGSFYLAPVPDAVYPLVADITEMPMDLALNTDIDLIPVPWSDAVPHYACHLAYRGENLMEQADKMLSTYEFYMSRARSGVTPQILPINYPGGMRARTAPGAAPEGPSASAAPSPGEARRSA